MNQAQYEVRFEWGSQGLGALAESSPEAVIIVDVLSFSTCVCVAVDRGARVFPYPWRDDGVTAYASEHRATVAGSRWDTTAEFSLSPASMMRAGPADRIVLPSPNGSALSFDAARHGNVVIAGCLRNRSAVSEYITTRATTIAVIAAGERWPDGSIRFALEDLLGAGSIIAQIPGSRSPEAEAAVAVFESLHERLAAVLRSCGSGRELAERGFPDDVAIAAERDASRSVPVLVDGCYRSASIRA